MGKTYGFMRQGLERQIFFYENGIKNDKQKTTQFKEKNRIYTQKFRNFLAALYKRFLRFWKLAPSRKMKFANPDYNLKLMFVFAANSFYSAFEAVKKKLESQKSKLST